MRKLIFFLALLLLLPLTGDAYDKGTDSLQTVSIQVTESAVPTSVENAASNEPDLGSPTRTPTFQEVREFILRDPTSRNEFVLYQYECRHFATVVNNNAEAEGLRCAFVLLCFDRGQHSVIAFETTDRGLVYIEPQTDAAIHPEVGSQYQGREIKEILIAW